MAIGVSGDWRKRGGKIVAAELALEWGLAPKTVRNLACEAWRRLQRATDDDRDLIASRLLLGVEGIFEDSVSEAKSPVILAGEKRVVEESPSVPRKIALEAAKTLAELLRQSTSLAQLGSPEYRALSTGEQRALIDRAKGKLAEFEAEVEQREASEAQMGAGER